MQGEKERNYSNIVSTPRASDATKLAYNQWNCQPWCSSWGLKISFCKGSCRQGYKVLKYFVCCITKVVFWKFTCYSFTQVFKVLRIKYNLISHYLHLCVLVLRMYHFVCLIELKMHIVVRESRETINNINFNVKCTVTGQSMVIYTCKVMSHQSPQHVSIL